jgi:hypothetical protein
MRSITPSYVVPAPRGTRIRTRLRLSEADEAVLLQVGEYLGSLAGGDLAWRCRLGPGQVRRADRKRALTSTSSSRWAGAITRTVNDQWDRAYSNLGQERASLRRAINRLRRRVEAPVGGRTGRVKGYVTLGERWEKQRRLQILLTRLQRVERKLASGHVSVARGGRKLARGRHQVDASGLTLERWRRRWAAQRLFLTADGEADKAWGNETIRWHPGQAWLELKLPASLAYLANQPHGRYRLSCQVSFSYRGDEVAAQATIGAVRYDITLEPERARWYLHASWMIHPAPRATVAQAVTNGVVAVDLNYDHLACWVVDRHGNPVGEPVTIPLNLDGLPSTTRDGRLRAAISAVVGLAQAKGVRAVAIENLGFIGVRAAGRETLGRGPAGKGRRRIIMGIPTARFRDRLVQMACQRGLWVVAGDPAYTSRWGARYWMAPLQRRYPSTIVTRHHAASVVIGRRVLGCRARRRVGMLHGDRRITGMSNCRPGRAQPGYAHGPGPPRSRPRTAPAGQTEGGYWDRARAEAVQDRSEPPISGHQTLMPQER